MKVILFFLEKSEDHLKKRKVKPKSSESFLKPGEGLDRSLEDSEDFGPHWKKEKAEKSCKEYNFRHINHIYYGLPHIFPSENEALQSLKVDFRLHEDLPKAISLKRLASGFTKTSGRRPEGEMKTENLLLMYSLID